MTEAEWLACSDPRDMLFPPGWRRGRRAARHRERPVPDTCHPRVTGERKLRLYACGCFRLSFPRLRYPADQRMLDAAERYADGAATEAELADAAARCGLAAAGLARRPAIGAARGAVGGGTVRADHPAGHQVLLPDPVRCGLLRCIFGNPFRPVNVDPGWLTRTVVGLATAIYADLAFDLLPILADALEETGCDNTDILSHCRGPGPHCRGCWTIDLVLGKE